MKKCVIFLAVLVTFVSCKSKEQKTKESLIRAIELEIVSAGDYDGCHVQAMMDTLPRLSALFYVAGESKSVNRKRLSDLFEERYGYNVSTEVDFLSLYYMDSSRYNIGLAIEQEERHITLFKKMLRDFPRKDSETAREYLTVMLDNSRSLLLLLNDAAAVYDRDLNDGAFYETYTICRNCGKVYKGDSVTECDSCGAGPEKLYVSRASDYPVPEKESPGDYPEDSI